MSDPVDDARQRPPHRLLYVAAVGPVLADKTFADLVGLDLGLDGTLGEVTDERLVGIAAEMADHYRGKSAFPIGALLGVAAAIERIGGSPAPDRIRVMYIVPESGNYVAYFEAVVRLATLAAPAWLSMPAGSRLEVESVSLPLDFRASDPTLCAATVAESIELRRTDAVVVVDGQVGEWRIKNPMLVLAAEARVPSVVAKESGAALWDFGTPIESAAYLAQVATGIQPGLSDQRRGQVAAHLVMPGAVPRPTKAALARMDAARWNVSGTYCATAQVLRAHPGGRARADELEALVERWIDQRVFDGSMVNEMVLHDQSHALSVDRNVSIIGGALLADDAIGIDDLFRLGCAAWLHDCGHSSARVRASDGAIEYDAVPTEPGFVREFHGPLTARRLARARKAFGLSKVDSAWVRVLAGHHQGWTSVRAGEAGSVHEQDSPEAIALGRALTSSLGQSLAAAGLTESEDGGRAVKLITVLRIADALDVGRHRVAHRDLHRVQLDRFVRIYTRRCIDAIDQGEPTDQLVGLLDTAGGMVARLVLTSNGQAQFRRTRRLIEQAIAALDLSLSRPDSRRISIWTTRLLAYYDYLFGQQEHFEKHERINTVIPVMSGAKGQRQLQVLVLPQPAALRKRKPVAGVREDFERELGWLGAKPDDKARRAFYAKAPVRDALKDLGVTVVRDDSLVTVPSWWLDRHPDERALDRNAPDATPTGGAVSSSGQLQISDEPDPDQAADIDTVGEADDSRADGEDPEQG